MGTGCEGRRRKHDQPIGPINLGTKPTGARSAVNPHAACEEAGAGNGMMERRVRHRQPKGTATDGSSCTLPRQPSTLPPKRAGLSSFLRCRPTGTQVARIGAGGPLPYADAEGSVRIFEPSRRVE